MTGSQVALRDWLKLVPGTSAVVRFRPDCVGGCGSVVLVVWHHLKELEEEGPRQPLPRRRLKPLAGQERERHHLDLRVPADLRQLQRGQLPVAQSDDRRPRPRPALPPPRARPVVLPQSMRRSDP